jgi:NitT/TauT family transport system substrate-binding protein
MAAAVAMVSSHANAEANQIRIAVQPGLTYLTFYLMEHDKLIEKHAKAAGLGDVAVTWSRFAGGNPMNDGLLSGTLDIACSGTPAFLILWAKARALDVRGVAAYNTLPLTLVTRNPNIKSVKDFTNKDRIAVPAVKASTQAIILEMAAEQAFGPGQHGKLDPLTVTLSHPDAMVALTSGRSEISAHFSAPPFTERELKTPGLHAVTTVKEVFGGDLTIGMAYSTGKFHKENPKLYGAFLAALTEAVGMIDKDKRQAAETYVAMAKDKTPVDDLVALMNQPGFAFGTTPQNVTKMAQFMNRIGSIGVAPKDWKEMFFPEIHNLPGS